MGKKIFVSYKYADDSVASLNDFDRTTVRDYVDYLEKKIEKSDNIYKGEHDGEDLSSMTDETIYEKLKSRIYDSTITIVMISPHMKEKDIPDKQQWIPWEISYSLKEISRGNKTSLSNALLAIILPDKNGKYNYISDKHYNWFDILKDNIDSKYAYIVPWNKFLNMVSTSLWQAEMYRKLHKDKKTTKI